jgi:hypothetical protein
MKIERFVPTPKWKDEAVEVPGYGAIKKEETLVLAGQVRQFLLVNDYVISADNPPKLEDPLPQKDTKPKPEK